MIMRILMPFACVAVSLCCKCAKLPPKEAYCRAQWVSLVNVTISVIDESKDPLEQRQYTVKHTEVLKKPPGCNSLSEKIYTSTESASCGVQLEVGKEYLLTGSYDDDKLNIITCGQIASEDYPGIIMERKDISANFLNEIKSYKC